MVCSASAEPLGICLQLDRRVPDPVDTGRAPRRPNTHFMPTSECDDGPTNGSSVVNDEDVADAGISHAAAEVVSGHSCCVLITARVDFHC